MATGSSTPTSASKPETPNQLPPIVVDLGKTRRKLIRALKRGEGRLMDDVAAAVEGVRSNLGAEVQDRTLIPVVIVYQRKTTRRRGLLPFAF